MMRRIFALLLALCLLVPAALAEEDWIGGEGWWDFSYAGEYVEIDGTDLQFKLPDGWYFEGVDEDGWQVYTDGLINLSIISQEVEFMDMVDEFDRMEAADTLTETSWIILQEDRDWLVGAARERFVACCPDEVSGTMVMWFEFDDIYGLDMLIRNVISSVCYTDNWED